MIQIGERIRNVRREKDITLIELARLTGVAQATLSRIETGDMIGTVECHQKVANALGMSLSELYEGIDERTSKTHHAKKTDGHLTSAQTERVKIELRTSKALKKKLLPLVITLKGNAETEEERAEKSVEKFIYVIDGDIIVHLNKQDHPLKQDESIYFDGSLPHIIINKSSKTAKIISIASPPA
ncbi:MAG: helix-turn-helix transcriptional regulator [Candidatus Omnitrophica bacterium]|nr:helix-turn-helix transcriptional regulator [Candidatus Omnitrophota bacterium]